jgi:hypothetical protein
MEFETVLARGLLPVVALGDGYASHATAPVPSCLFPIA